MAMDPEFLALQRMFKIIDALSTEQAARVLGYCQQRVYAKQAHEPVMAQSTAARPIWRPTDQTNGSLG